MEAKTAAEKITRVQEYLSDMKIEERVTACMRNFEKNGIPESIDYFEQSYKAIGDILEQAKELLGALTMNGFDLAALLRSGFESAVIRLIPQGADEVSVGDIGISRLQDIRLLIVLGMNEGKIPNYEEESGILAQQEKDFIYSEILHMGNTSQIVKQKLAIYRAFSLPSERLVLIYSQTGKEQMQPSPLIARMHELFSIKETEASELIGSLRENSILLAQAEIRNLANGYKKDKEYLACLLAREDTRDLIVDMGRFAARTNVAESLKKPIAAELYPKGTASASRYEAYYSCPFRHYVLYGLHAEVPRESTLAGVDVGNFVHGVLDSVSREIKNTGQSWKNVSQAQLVNLLRSSSEEVRERDFKYTVSPRNMNVLRTVERELYWALSAIRQHFETSSLEMEETEHKFELDVGGIRIRGIIDRLDIARAGETTWFKVVDYKTGQKEWFLQDFVEGLSLQLVIYMLAGMEYLRQLEDSVRPAGADYFTVKLPLLEQYEPEKLLSEFKMQGLQGVEPEDAKQVYGFDGNGIVSVSLRLKKDGSYYSTDSRNVYSQEELTQLMEYAKKLITGAAAEIESGNVQIAPLPNQQNVAPCTYCDFRSVCMLDDAQIPQKKERQSKDLLLKTICNKN
ncbi:MAG: PD-(D/E)XK nuclease family protein [Eubacteriales bacterium]